MIRLQHEQQRRVVVGQDEDAEEEAVVVRTPAPSLPPPPVPRNSVAIPHGGGGGERNERQFVRLTAVSPENQFMDHQRQDQPSPPPPQHHHQQQQQQRIDPWHQFSGLVDPDVGKGTLVFPPSGIPESQLSPALSSDGILPLPKMHQERVVAGETNLTSRLKPSTHQLNLSTYGAVDDGLPQEHDWQGDNREDGNRTRPIQLTPSDPIGTNTLATRSDPRDQSTDLLYGNTDYPYPYEAAAYNYSETSRFHRNEPSTSILGQCCNCLWSPWAACVRQLCRNEALHRSLCFGAIDGMLTGSGIVATFYGMDLVDTHSKHITALHTVLVIFSAAACFADALCMAIGHVWTSHVLASVQARERGEMRQQLQNSKADCKGLLVDMLLAKGVLKIDAMSMADTLEGYPDLFLAAVLGESLANVVVTKPPQHAITTTDAYGNDRVGSRVGNPHSGLSDYPSYGRLLDIEMDPDAVIVRNTTSESRNESLFLMVGFSVFALIPGLLFQWIPDIMSGTGGPNHPGTIHSLTIQPKTSMVANVHPSSVILAIMAVVMWLLGVWKSHFLDSNWLLFGIEAVLVLFLCIAAAFLVGWALKFYFLQEYNIKLILTPVDKEYSSSSGFRL